MKPFIIPIFLPQWGCPQQCVYCRQETITGERRSRLEMGELSRIVQQGLASKRRKKDRPVEIAFYGGNFTGLPPERQQRLLDWGSDYIGRGLVGALRVSTRPDALNDEVLTRLKRFGVRTVELGFQALDDQVLERSLRGHTVRENLQALIRIKEHGLTAGVQLMPGLPGDRPDRFLASLALLRSRPPDFVRLYPALVFDHTPLARWYLEGAYKPLGLAEALEVCARAVAVLEASGIPVLRIGLQSTGGPDFLKNMLAGPYHPAFGDLVRGRLFLEKVGPAVRELTARRGTCLELRVGEKEAGYLTGNGGRYLAMLKSELGCSTLALIREPRLRPGEWEIRRGP